MKKIVKKVSALTAALMATITSSVVNTFAFNEGNTNTPTVTMLAAANPFQELADWINSWSSQATVLVPALGSILMLGIGLVVMFAGREWSGKAKSFAGAIIAGLAIISYGPLLISSMSGQ